MLRICGDNATVGGGHPEWLMNLVDMLVDKDMNFVDMFVDKAMPKTKAVAVENG